jgi:uncharacterized protein (DUF983 family)
MMNDLNPREQQAPPAIEHVFIRRGSTCPHCNEGKLDYNGLLELECDKCGYSLSSGAGCS